MLCALAAAMPAEAMVQGVGQVRSVAAAIGAGAPGAVITEVISNSYYTLPTPLNINPGDEFWVDSGATLMVAGGGSYTNDGAMLLRSTGDTTTFALFDSGAGSTVALGSTGGGQLILSNSLANRIVAYSSGMTLVNGAGHTIVGSGQIGAGDMTLVNSGTITSNQSAGMYFWPGAGGVTNNGLIQVTSGSWLTLYGFGATQYQNANIIQAVGPGSTLNIWCEQGITGGTVGVVGGGAINLSTKITNAAIYVVDNSWLNVQTGAEVSGGSVNVTGTGTVSMTGSKITSQLNNGAMGTVAVTAWYNEISQLNNIGVVRVDNGATLGLNSGVAQVNNGVIALNSTGGTTTLVLHDVGWGKVMTLQGGGQLVMSNSPANRIVTDSTDMGLVNDFGHTIIGAGQIGAGDMMLVNNGAITSNQPAGMTVWPSTRGVINNGLIQVTSGSTLTLYGFGVTPYQNTNIIQAVGPGSTLNIWCEQGITGGTVGVVGGGAINLSTKITNAAIYVVDNSWLNVQTGAEVSGGAVNVTGPGMVWMTGGKITGQLNNGPLGTVEIAAWRNEIGRLNNSGLVRVDGGTTLALDGGITHTNNGVIALNSTGGDTTLVLHDAGWGKVMTFQGGGQLVMSNSTSNRIVADSTDMGLVNDVGHTILGAGQIGAGDMMLVNNGTITSNLSAGMTIWPSTRGVTNNGLIQVTSGSTMRLIGDAATPYQSTNIIQAVGPGSTLNIWCEQGVTGGTVGAVGGSVINLSTKITNAAVYVVDNSWLNVQTGAEVSGGAVNVTGPGMVWMTGGKITGQLNNSPVGTVEIAAWRNEIGRLSNSGLVRVDNGATLAMYGGVANTNNGAIALNSTGDVTSLVLHDAGWGQIVSLQGFGQLVMSNSTSNRIVADSTDMGLVNDFGHTIIGAGQIGAGDMMLVNNGTITSNLAVGMIVWPGTSGLVNNGLIQVTSGSAMRLIGDAATPYQNTNIIQAVGPGSTLNIWCEQGITGGTVGAVGGSVINLSTKITNAAVYVVDNSWLNVQTGAEVSSGAVNVTGPGMVMMTGGKITGQLNNGAMGTVAVTAWYNEISQLNNSGLVRVDNGATLAMYGGVANTNNGVIALNATGGDTTLVLHDAGWGKVMTFQGFGQLVMSNSTSNRIVSDSPGMTLVNDLGHTIIGAGQIGASDMMLVNNGTITSNLAVGMTIWPGAGGLVNNGTLQAIGGGVMTIQSGAGKPFVNTGTVFVSAGSTISVNGPATQTGGQTIVDGLFAAAAMDVQNGALTGDGVIDITAGELAFGDAALFPGDTVGMLTVNGKMTFQPGSILNYDLSTPDVVGGGVNDLMTINGDLVLDGSLFVNGLGGFGAGVYRLFDYTGELTDNGLDVAFLPGGWLAFVDLSTANEVNLVVASATGGSFSEVIPEPGTLALLAIGSMGLLLRRRSR